MFGSKRLIIYVVVVVVLFNVQLSHKMQFPFQSIKP